MVLRLLVSFCVFVAPSLFAQAQSFMPDNDLHLQDNLNGGGDEPNITKEQFMAMIEKTEKYFAPIVAKHKAKLNIERLWDDTTVNAYAEKKTDGETKIWNVAMFGGLARRSEVTPDGFQLVVCHELGHHLGGYAFILDHENMSNEGQSDYYSTQACARAIWKDSPAENAIALQTAPPIVVALCENAWTAATDRAICARSVVGGKSLSKLLAALHNLPAPQVETPSTDTVTKTNDRHPEAQCRLDTYIAGAICTKKFDLDLIPGINSVNEAENSIDSEKSSNKVLCNQKDGDAQGSRPKCWFASLIK